VPRQIEIRVLNRLTRTLPLPPRLNVLVYPVDAVSLLPIHRSDAMGACSRARVDVQRTASTLLLLPCTHVFRRLFSNAGLCSGSVIMTPPIYGSNSFDSSFTTKGSGSGMTKNLRHFCCEASVRLSSPRKLQQTTFRPARSTR